MKICYLSNARSVHTQRWARHFSKRGHEVSVISFEPGEIEGVDVMVPERMTAVPKLDILLSLGKIRRWVHGINPDILHAHYATSYGLAGALCRRRPFVVTAWGSDVLIEPERYRLYRWMIRFVLKRADLITTTADNATERIVKRQYAAAERIITFPFGVDTEMFHPGVRTGISGRNLVVSTRYLDHRSDADIFLRAIPKVIQRCPDARFMLVGDGALRSPLEKLADELNIRDHIDIRGKIPHGRMPAFLGEVGVYVSTYPSDTNHVSLNEAMACGAFPVVTDIAANRAWIEPGVNGMLYPCRDVDRLADCIVAALEKPGWREAIVPHNWDIIRTKASWSNSMEEMERHYRRLIEEKGNCENGQ